MAMPAGGLTGGGDMDVSNTATSGAKGQMDWKQDLFAGTDFTKTTIVNEGLSLVTVAVIALCIVGLVFLYKWLG